ncbi:MAG: prolipoprotein diacylglyceryl transferase family protein [Eubacteriales bacterium]
MHPILQFAIGDLEFQIPSYTFFAAAGAITGAVTALPFLKREGLSIFASLRMLLFMACSFLIGARLFNAAVNPSAYTGQLHIYSLQLTGLSLYGGVTGAMLAFAVWTAVHRVSPRPILDALVLPSAAAFALARVGCFLNGCCAGKATDSFLGVVFPSRQGGGQFTGILALLGKTSVAVYPTQLFELSLALIGLIPVLWLYFRKRPRAGTVFLLYGIWFTAMRWAILPLRNLPYSETVKQVFLPLLYCGLIIAGIMMLLWPSGRKIGERMQNKAEN